MAELKIAFTDREITPWGGIAMLVRMLEKLRFEEMLDELALPSPGSNRGYCPKQLVKQFVTSIWCGANRFEHCEITRHDEVMRQIWGFRQMAGHKAIQRFFNRHTRSDNADISRQVYRWFFEGQQFDNYTLDIDSTVITRYGSQQGASVGHHPHKRGRASHHPLMAFVAENRMVANFWLRPGNAHTSNNLEAFLADTIEKLNGRRIGLLRADSGFYDRKIFHMLEEHPLCSNYIIAAKFHSPIQRALAQQEDWGSLGNGIGIAETMFQCPSWEKPRRLIMVRQLVRERPRATGKTLRLFNDDILFDNYRYTCLVTNSTLPPTIVWRLYRDRAESENRIKELKYDFGVDSFNMQSFEATQAALDWAMMAYNLISLFRHVVINNKVHERMKTLRYQVFAIGGYQVKQGSERILKLSLAMKRRQWFLGLWGESKNFNLPVIYDS
jgi:hypothetical protein